MKKKLATLVFTAVSALTLSSCGGLGVKEYNGTEVQGVTESEILVGNTTPTTGDFAKVGIPFNAGLKAVFKDYSAKGGKKITLRTYDDGFDGAKGKKYTKKLVETDKVFALVGHFGTNTVASTIDYIKDKGVPMVYAATGINQLYQEKAEGYHKAVISVQPIFKTEGRTLLARAVAPVVQTALPTEQRGVNIYGDEVKVGVIYTNDDVGNGIKEGIETQALEMKVTNNITYAETRPNSGYNHTNALVKLQKAGCQIIIVAANQAPFQEIVKYMANLEMNATILTSYLNADSTILGDLADSNAINDTTRRVFTAGWLDVTTTEGAAQYAEYQRVILSDDEAKAHVLSSYALAGYVAGSLFIEGIERVKNSNLDLTWKNYIDALESTAVQIPMGGKLDLSNGKRYGTDSFALNGTLTQSMEVGGIPFPAGTLLPYAGLQSLDTIWESVSTGLKK